MDPEQIPLRDLHLPAEVGWWPLAPGWWILIALGAGLVLWYAWLKFEAWRANRARRVALRELAWVSRRYEESGDVLRLAGDLSELLRRGLLAYAPRSEVAGLTGDRWLAWLDRGLDEPVFERGAGRLIVSLPYQNPDRVRESDEVDALIDAVRLRLRTPLAEVNA